MVNCDNLEQSRIPCISIQIGATGKHCSLGYLWTCKYYDILAQKIRQEKLS